MARRATVAAAVVAVLKENRRFGGFFISGRPCGAVRA
jgi:hypothetical protein